MNRATAFVYLLLYYIGSATSTPDCVPVFVRWNRVKLNLATKQSGPFSLQQCADACSKKQSPPGVNKVTIEDCGGFSYKEGADPFSNDCQLYENDQKITVDDHVEADDRYAYYWKYCAEKFYFNDPSRKNCKSVHYFDFHIDRYIDMADVERTIRTDRVEDCLNRCLDEPAFVCRSVSFNRTGRLCSLSPQSQVTKPSSLRVNNNPNYRIDYYENSCINASGTFEFRHDCRENGVIVSVDSKFPYSGAMYGLYDFFTCRIEPKDETKFAYFFPKPNYSKNCSDSFSVKDGQDVLDLVLSTDGMEPLYFLTDQDTMYQAKCPITKNGQEQFTTRSYRFVAPVETPIQIKEVNSSLSMSTTKTLPSSEQLSTATSSLEASTAVAHSTSTNQTAIHPNTSTVVGNYSLSFEPITTESSFEPITTESVAIISWTFPDDTSGRFQQSSTEIVASAPQTSAATFDHVLDVSPTFKQAFSTVYDALDVTLGAYTSSPASSTLKYADLMATPTTLLTSDVDPFFLSTAHTEASTRSSKPFEESSDKFQSFTDDRPLSNFVNRRKVEQTTLNPPYHPTVFTVPDDQGTTSRSAAFSSTAGKQGATRFDPWSEKPSQTDDKEKTTPKFETFFFELPSTANIIETTDERVRASTDAFLNNEITSSTLLFEVPKASPASVSWLSENNTINRSTSVPSLHLSTPVPSQEKIQFEIFHNKQPVTAVVVASRIVLSLSPALLLPPGAYINVIGCQVEPINSPYASERDPIQIINGGCQADGVGLVCPPLRVDSAIKIEMEALRYTHTSEILFSCLVRICNLGRCLQPTCRSVDGCFSDQTLSPNSFQAPNGGGFGGFKNLALQRHKRQAFQAIGGKSFLPFVPAFEIPGAFQEPGSQFTQYPQILQGPQPPIQDQSLSQSQLQRNQGLSLLSPQDSVVSKKLIVVNTEAELQYFLRTGSVPSRGTIFGNSNSNGFAK